MPKTKQCITCGSDIVFSYKTPTKSFRIEDGKIVRDDAWEGPEWDNPYLKFYCSNDTEHEVENDSEVIQWSEKVENEFYEKIFPDL